MKLSIGNDIVSNDRIRKAVDDFGDRFLKRVFTEEEIEYCKNKKDPIPHLAARFACKEAFIKAVGTSSQTLVDMKEISLRGREFGKKKLFLTGKSKELFHLKGFTEADASVSHCESYSTAVVLLYQEEKEGRE